MAEYFAMGGYADFVWPAYGITALVTLGLIVWSLRGHRAVKMRIAALEARADASRADAAGRS